MSQQIQNANPSASLGVTAVTPPNLWSFKRDPGPTDNKGYVIGDQWRNTKNQNLWWYASSFNKILNTFTATWILLSGGAGDINSVMTDSGTATAINGLINLQGQPQAGKTVIFSAAGNVIKLNVTDTRSNTFIGLNSGYNIGASNFIIGNTALGSSALAALTIGIANTAIGSSALDSITDGGGNTAVGADAGSAITTGASNVAVGSSALLNVITGSANIGLGTAAGSAYLGAESFNIVIGQIGLAGEIGNTRVGATDPGNTTNSANTFIGYNAGNNTFTLGNATSNTCLGAYAGQSLTTGEGNILTGNAAGTRITTGTGNCAYGANALAESFAAGLTTGSNNVAIGDNALYSVATGSNNVVIGANSGGNYNGGETNNIILGYGIGGSNAESNVCRIGNIYGSTVGATNTAVFVDSTGKLGTTGSGSISAFSYYSTSANNVTGDGTEYFPSFANILFDVNGDFNTGTSLFTAPVTGIYQFIFTATLGNLGTANTAASVGDTRIIIKNGAVTVNDNLQNNVYFVADDTSQWQCTASCIVQMTAGWTAQAEINSTLVAGGALTTSIVGGSATDPRTVFMGCRLA